MSAAATVVGCTTTFVATGFPPTTSSRRVSQAICDALGPDQIQAFVQSWLQELPSV
jgi:hypothetical protein